MTPQKFDELTIRLLSLGMTITGALWLIDHKIENGLLSFIVAYLWILPFEIRKALNK
jgi:hypothetical protein